MATEWDDDDALLAALGAALAEAADVPASITRAGRDVYSWRTVDAELATLAFDSTAQPGPGPALVRGGRSARRSLTFESPGIRIDADLEYDPDALRGQVTAAPRPGRLVVEIVGAQPLSLEIDEVGYFSVEPFPAARSVFRLRCGAVVSPWIS